MSSKKKFLALALVLFALAGIVKAADSILYYPGTAQVGELNSISSADAANLTDSSYSGRVFQINHKQTVTVSGSFSVAGANAVIGICRGKMVDGTFKIYRWAPINFLTITADGTYTIDGTRYGASAAAFDTCNADAAFIFVKSVSSGNVIAGWSVH